MIKHFKTSTLKDYMSLARELGMLEGKIRTDNMLVELWKRHGADTCVAYEEKLDGEKSWEVTNYNTALSEGEMVTVYATDDVLPNDLNKNDVMNNDMKIYHVETQEDYDDLMINLEKQGYIWESEELPTANKNWSKFEEDTYISLNKNSKRFKYGYIGSLDFTYFKDEVVKHKAGDDLELETDKTRLEIYHTETQENFNYLMRKLEESDIIWCDGNLPSECDYYWLDFERETCVVVNNGEINHFPEYKVKEIYDDVEIKKIKMPKYEIAKIKELQKYSEKIAKKKEDLVNHPRHYNQYSQEVIDTIEEVTANMPVEISYHVGNAIKYLFRAPFKGKMKQDIEKAVWYLERSLTKL